MMLATIARYTRMLTFSYVRMSNYKPKTKNHEKITTNVNSQVLNKQKTPKVFDSKQILQQKKKENKQTIKQSNQQQINWKKYGRQVSDILQSKKKLIDIDLAFLANKISSGELIPNQQITNTLKAHIKALKQANFSLLPQLIQLAFSLGLVTPPQLFLQTYLEHFKHNTFSIEENQVLGFPTFFLKRVGLQTFLICVNRNIEQGAIALKFFGSILSVNELKKADQLCSQRIGKMNVEQVAKLLSIFRQIRKRGTFVELSESFLVEKQLQLTNKSIITTVVSFLELGNREALNRLENTLAERVIGEKFIERQVISLLHVMHKYKAGKLTLWQNIEKYFMQKHKKIPLEHLFLIMSGLTRNYNINADYLQMLIQGDSSLAYASKLQDKQFVQFYFVLYAHYCLLTLSQQKKLEPILLSAIKAAKLTSVYMQIQSFFLYLIESSSQKQKQHLKAAYPDDTLLALLSCIRQFENTDIRQQQQYQKDLISRFGQDKWKQYRHVIVAQQFIRYKLVSTMQKNPEASPFRTDDF